MADEMFCLGTLCRTEHTVQSVWSLMLQWYFVPDVRFELCQLLCKQSTYSTKTEMYWKLPEKEYQQPNCAGANQRCSNQRQDQQCFDASLTINDLETVTTTDTRVLVFPHETLHRHPSTKFGTVSSSTRAKTGAFLTLSSVLALVHCKCDKVCIINWSPTIDDIVTVEKENGREKEMVAPSFALSGRLWPSWDRLQLTAL